MSSIRGHPRRRRHARRQQRRTRPGLGRRLQRSGHRRVLRPRPARHRHGRRQADAARRGHSPTTAARARASASGAVKSSASGICRTSPRFRACASWCCASPPTATPSWSPARRSPTSSTELLEIADVADLIAAKASSSEAKRSKPDPDIVQAALQRSGAPAEQAIMLGDTPYDVEAALACRHCHRRCRVRRLGRRRICAARWRSIPEPRRSARTTTSPRSRG